MASGMGGRIEGSPEWLVEVGLERGEGVKGQSRGRQREGFEILNSALGGLGDTRPLGSSTLKIKIFFGGI